MNLQRVGSLSERFKDGRWVKKPPGDVFRAPSEGTKLGFVIVTSARTSQIVSPSQAGCLLFRL